MILITKPFLPPKKEYEEFLEGIWKREWVTNHGPLVRELEEKLQKYLNVDGVTYVSNGTIALQFAIKALEVKGEVITTPFSYVATTSSLVWEGVKPVFVDIDPDTLNLDPAKIEQAITKKTEAILATHVFGNPCDVEAIQKIADQHGLKVIYDAAHCFGTTYKGKSIFEYGDVATCSFHATKIFQTIEGGAVFVQDKDLQERIYFMRNFGHDGPGEFNGLGINGKNTEFHAAMGLVNLRYIDRLLQKRKEQYQLYEKSFKNLPLQMIKLKEREGFNYAYFSAVFETEEAMLSVKKVLEEQHIYPRRYFYPPLNALDYVKGNTPISDSISARILCLPLYHELKQEEQELIIEIISKTFSNG